MTGKVSEQQQKKVTAVAHQLMKTRPSGLKFVFQNIPVRDALEHLLNAEIVSYGGNAQSPFIELSNGKRLVKGSQLMNGDVIEYINMNGLDLSRAGELIHVPLIF